MGLALVVVAALVGSAGVALWRPTLPAAFVLVALCGIWFPVNNGRLEGRVLWTVDAVRGLTVADLASFAGFAIAVLTVLRWSRRRGGSATGSTWGVCCVALVGLLVVLGSAMTYTWMNQPV